MIITVTMNAALDKTVELANFQPGALNRVDKTVTDPGGKGINVSKTLKSLGGESIAAGFLGGNTGRMIANMLKEMAISEEFIFVPGETRTNLKIVEPSGRLTELNESGMRVSPEKAEELTEKILKLTNKDTLVILSGSVPKSLSPSVYGTMIHRIREKGGSTFLDADGALFEEGVKALPTMVKPNRFELEQYFKVNAPGDAKVIELGRRLQRMGIPIVLISLGEEGSIFLTPKGDYKAGGIPVAVRSTVGAGDAMVAAFSYGFSKNMEMEACIRLAVAASAGAVMTVGTKAPDEALIRELEQKVVIENIAKLS